MSELKEIFYPVNEALSDACDLALKQPIPGKQLFLMTDASFRTAGYDLMIKNTPNQKKESKWKTYVPVTFGSEIFSPAQLNCLITQKNIFQFTWPFLSLYTFSGKQQSQQMSSQSTNP